MILCLLPLLIAGCGPLERPTGTLYLAARHPGTVIRVDAARQTATVRAVPQYGGGDPPYTIAYTGGRVVLRGWSLSPDLTDPRNLGESWFFLPSATPGRIWNILLKPGGAATEVHFRGVREVTVDGRTTFARRAAVPGWATVATDAGLVVQHGGLSLWDPRTGRDVRRLPGVFPLAAHGSLLASCAFRCRAVHFTDTRTGERWMVRGRFQESYEGAFSPDGRLFATLGVGGEIKVVDVTRRRARTIARPPERDHRLLAWASSGWLFYGAGRGRIGAWRPGERKRRLAVSVRPYVDMAAD